MLAVPALQAHYLANVRTLAEKDLDWRTLGPVVARLCALIDAEVQADTRKLDAYADFQGLTADAAPAEARGRTLSLRALADGRRAYLLGLPAVRDAK